ncbi:hypothetical protein K505DRAFT_345006 [Melanomma pulvis-pyrius CBS 109.77]|uniref:Apoptosis-inducing TAF9-like domain 1 family protein n=1 Tax=Melanomma pulvis-pyrius CBS 109.77 TaxID=1314802 RepID=A0A6A6XYC8_9PLEO|nr:hypothetical protein K505DRAFT_345006 [Melanomma pulvis-pyrius CBS 109.77]
MATATALEQEERFKSALWFAIGKFVDDECVMQNLNATPQFIGALTELVYTQIENTSRDLETFAKHAGRRIINTDDVMLLARRNEGLDALLRETLEAMKAREARAEKENTGRAKPAAKTTAKGKGKGKAKQ